MTKIILQVKALTAGYSTLPVLESVELGLADREIGVIVGPNGAGKSTLLKTIFGLVKVFSGSIEFKQESIVGLPTNKLVPKGIAAVPQSKNVFPSLSVDENLDVGTYALKFSDLDGQKQQVLTLFPELRKKLKQAAGELSGGQRQMVAFGRALMSKPQLLVLDEPTAGLSPAYLEIIFDMILRIRDHGVTVLMVEQNAKQALKIADRGFVLANGKNLYTDTGASLLANPEVHRAFLGGNVATDDHD